MINIIDIEIWLKMKDEYELIEDRQHQSSPNIFKAIQQKMTEFMVPTSLPLVLKVVKRSIITHHCQQI